MSNFSGHFATTHWSVVLAAGEGSTPQSRSALEALCSTYWYPLYAYVRHRGYRVDEAQDLTQEFFATFLERNYLPSISPEKGRFRAYLRAAVNNFLISEWGREQAQKRGGGRTQISLDLKRGEERYQLELAEPLTPEKIYERRWACEVLERVVARVREEFEKSNKARLFEALKFCLTGEARPDTYSRIAGAEGIKESYLRVLVHRLRKRYSELLKEEISQTVGREDDIDDEVRHLFETLSQ